jgi:glycosyltransferase involved in cell wall biosynthesis
MSAPAHREWPSVTALILAYNYGPFLAECVESALAQDYPGPLEVLVVDDGSTDETPEVLAGFGDRIRVIRQENAGVNAAMTRGMLAARGEGIALLDADDAWLPEKLRHQVRVLLERPEVGFVYSDFTPVDPRGRAQAPSWFAHQNVSPPSGRVLGTFLRQCMSWGSTIVIRASLIEHVLPVPPEASFQDAYLSARAAEVTEFAYVARPLMRYRVHGENAWAGASGAKELRNTRKDAGFLRWMLVNRPLEDVSVEDLVLAHKRFTWLRQEVAA